MPEQKIALITGGSRGLGKNMALHLAQQGIHTIITYRTQREEAARVVAELESIGVRAAALALDTSEIITFDAFFLQLQDLLKKHFSAQRFHHLVNNGGVGAYIPFDAVEEQDFDRLINILYKGVFFLTQKALPHLHDGGSIINISSGLTRFSQPGSSVYASAKGAIEILTRIWAKELGPRKIRVNTVAPGAIATDFNAGRVRDTPQIAQLIAQSTALGRVGLPDDIGGVISFLCSENARWINGQRIEVSGGAFL